VARPSAKRPQIDPITLDDLVDNDGSLLRRGDSRDAERYSGTDLGGADLTGITFRECEFRAVSLNEAKLRGASFSECVAADLHAPVLTAPHSTWRDVRIERSRLGSVEVYEANLRSVEITGSKLDFVNLRDATLLDVVFSDCVIDELDLGSATIRRMELRDCRIGTLELAGAKLTDVDLRSSDFSAIHGLDGLRGATIDDAQLSLFAPLLAAHLGILVA
jgi:uncharacterized protein YjbI with pentapeptide repeats